MRKIGNGIAIKICQTFTRIYFHHSLHPSLEFPFFPSFDILMKTLCSSSFWISIFSENNKVFFNGKSIFALNETFGKKIRNSETAAHCVIRYNYELIDFQKRCLDDQGNLDDLVDIVAGKTHFVVLTSKSIIYLFN